MDHLIHRQVLELKFANQKDAQFWPLRFSELNRRTILPELERVFSLVAGERNIRIDTLEIDLGRLRQSDLEISLVNALRQTVTAALQPYLGEAQEASPGKKSRLPNGEIDNHLVQSPQPSFDAGSLLELFELFFQSGQLPWWLQRELIPQLDRLYQSFWRLAPDTAAQLVRQTIAAPDRLSRFVAQLSGRSHRIGIQQLMPPAMAASLLDLRKLAARVLVRNGFGREARTLSFTVIYDLIRIGAQRQPESLPALGSLFFTILGRLSGLRGRQLLREVDAAVSGARVSTATVGLLAALLRERASYDDVDAVPPSRQEGGTEKPHLASFPGLDVAIGNAGLVLIWPHLKELFKRLGLLQKTDDGRLRPKAEAVLLLQQLATGHPSGQENLLLLNKLLCGFPCTAAVPRRWRRSKDWDEQAGVLLTTVIKQWAALKNTSVEGLRKSFFQREGILREQGEGWHLQVERKSYDILLEQLPWGIGMIRLSWMQRPLLVEW